MKRMLLLALILSGACAFLPRKPSFNHMTPSTGLGRKKVVDKRDPAWLVAADRTKCSVSADKYERTAIGDKVVCAWVAE